MSCKIYLDDCGGYYYPGSAIKGRVECNFEEDVTFRSIKVRLKGKEHIGWQNGKNTFAKDNHILKEERILVGRDNSEDNLELKKGVYSFPFSYNLPYEIPSTFKGTYGSIAYTLKAIVDIPLWKDYTHKLTLFVNSPLVYNISSPYFPPKVAYSNEKTVCCCCFNRGQLAMELELPTTAFVSGETVNFQIYVCNLTASNVDDLKIKLKQKVTYGPPPFSPSYRVVKEEIVAITEPGIGAHGEFTYDLSMKIPESFQVLSFTNSKLFVVNYKLQVYCRMFSGFSKLIIEVPDIKIGHAKCDANTVAGEDTVVFSSNPSSYEIMVPLS